MNAVLADFPTSPDQRRVGPTRDRAQPGRGGPVAARDALDVLVVTSEAPPIVSGISRCIDRLDTGLRARGNRVDVLSAVQIRRLELGEWRLSSFVGHWPRIARALRGVDVVNVHAPIPTMSDALLTLVATVPSHSRPAVVVSYHSPIDIRRLSPLCRTYNAAHAGLARRGDAIIASSEYYAQAHRTRYGPPVQVVPWGVDAFPDHVPVARRADGPLRVLFVGQMRAYKGVDVLLAAVAGAADVEVVCVGSGALLDRYRAAAARAGARNVTFAGRLSDADLQAHYAAADVVVLPSVNRAEAFGLVLLEGMAAGCVPVASDLPGVRDVAVPTGVVVPPGDAVALRAALLRLAADRPGLLARQDASRRAAGRMSWDACVQRYEEVFLDAARRRYQRLHGAPHPRFGPAGAVPAAAVAPVGPRHVPGVRPVPDPDWDGGWDEPGWPEVGRHGTADPVGASRSER